MEKIIQFIESNWQYLSFAITALAYIVFIFIKKRSKVEIYDDSVCNELLDLVIKAEDQIGSGHGAEKMDFVLSEYIAKHPGLKDYKSVIQSIVERILKSPQRKEK